MAGCAPRAAAAAGAGRGRSAATPAVQGTVCASRTAASDPTSQPPAARGRRPAGRATTTIGESTTDVPLLGAWAACFWRSPRTERGSTCHLPSLGRDGRAQRPCKERIHTDGQKRADVEPRLTRPPRRGDPNYLPAWGSGSAGEFITPPRGRPPLPRGRTLRRWGTGGSRVSGNGCAFE